jgi:hypothetical protein
MANQNLVVTHVFITAVLLCLQCLAEPQHHNPATGTSAKVMTVTLSSATVSQGSDRPATPFIVGASRISPYNNMSYDQVGSACTAQ